MLQVQSVTDVPKRMGNGTAETGTESQPTAALAEQTGIDNIRPQLTNSPSLAAQWCSGALRGAPMPDRYHWNQQTAISNKALFRYDAAGGDHGNGGGGIPDYSMSADDNYEMSAEDYKSQAFTKPTAFGNACSPTTSKHCFINQLL